ncbi:uncharacterized protein zmp:0000000650 [Puntigrus tetrazona]|uniref:uncharacterized protein zmp:0000000650 n=1 Tax=Puntigrus tetrazona TaxID=1606681 RepID=UPI001C897BC9|nr:uncharacterized protein zmp:0000000650 [Puntigrus tetrazona]
MSTAEKICIFIFLLQGVCCKDFSISLSEKIEALSGSCVIINCSFEIEDYYDQFLNETDATGVWLKDGTHADINQVFNSRNPKPGHLSGKITGNLHEKNCTTIFYDVSSRDSGSYYFRIMSGKGLSYNYIHHFSTINVIESPPKPRVQLYVDEEKRQDQEEVLEGSSVSLRCSAETLCSSSPATLTWSSTPRIPLNDSSRLQELISDLKFTATHREHRVTFTCTITYQIQDQNKTAQDSITLLVQYSPKDTSVSVFPSSSVLEGSSVTLSCSSESNPAVMNYTWSREREGQLEQLQTGQNLTFNRTDPTHRGWYHCTAQNQHGAQNSSVMLDIQYAPQISTSSSCISGDVTVCLCEADGNPSPELEWHLSGRPVTNSSNKFISEERLSSTGLRSSITLHQSLTNTSTLLCVSRNTRGSDKQLFHVVFITQKAPGFYMYPLLIGISVGTVFMAILWVTTLLYTWLCRTQTGGKAGLIQTDGADSGDSRGEPFYANKVVLSSAEDPALNHPEPLHYSTINFTSTSPEANGIRGISSLTSDYAVVRYCGQNVKGSEEKNGWVSSVPHGEDLYQVPRKAAAEVKQEGQGHQWFLSFIRDIVLIMADGLCFSLNERMNIWTAEKIILLSFILKGVCCKDFSISLSEKIEALSGSCVIINCSFEIRDDYDQFLTEKAATGIWLKDGTHLDNNQVFNSINPKPGHLNGKITGNLHEKNCTTIFYNVSSRDSGSYYFRIMSGKGLSYNYIHHFSTINVIESPPKPRVQLYVDEEKRQDQEEVLEGSSVSLRCSAETLCSSSPATLTWSSTPRIPLNDSSRLQELISDLKFTATHREHRVTFTCTITYQIQDQNKTAQDSITLHVQYPPKDTSVSVFPSSSVLEGSSVTLSCSSESNPAVMNYTWSREREGQLEQLQTGQNLTFNRADPTHRGWYHCTAQNQHGAQNSSVMLDIQYAPQNMSTLAIPSSSVLEGSSVTLSCSSESNPAVMNYTWSREREGQLEQLQTGQNLTFNRTDPTHRGWYHCTAQNQHGAQNSSVMLDIQYAPQISTSSSCISGDVTVCLCEADGNPSPELEWHLSGRPVTNSSNRFISEERLSSTGLRSSITLHQSLTNTSTLLCVSRNTRGSEKQLFPLLQKSGFHHLSFLVGAAGGATVMMILCGILFICARRESNTRRDGLILTDLEDERDPVYANNMLSPNGAVTQSHRRDSLHYSSIDFRNVQPESEEIRGMSSLTTEYAALRCYPGGVSEAESSTGADQPNSSISAVMTSEENPTIQEEQEANIREEFSQPSEDTIYESITH